MKKCVVAVAAGCCILFFIITGGFFTATSAKEAESSLDAFTIENKGYKSERKGPVDFSHRKHAMDYRVSCWDCHHEYKDGKNIYSPWEQTQQCSECHDPVKSKDKIPSLQKAFHMNCRDCHLKMAEQKKKTGPYRKCFGCHKEEAAKKK
ncbi:MAG: hypothetical protein C4576_15610 [Desulfobacteraceae bacterium]|nr:MAG: hypothetical protein C4576_15610 [Desulfobacteraceae bacterium]